MFGGSNQHPGKTEHVRDVTPGTFGGQEFIVSHSFLAATENSLLHRHAVLVRNCSPDSSLFMTTASAQLPRSATGTSCNLVHMGKSCARN